MKYDVSLAKYRTTYNHIFTGVIMCVRKAADQEVSYTYVSVAII